MIFLIEFDLEKGMIEPKLLTENSKLLTDSCENLNRFENMARLGNGEICLAAAFVDLTGDSSEDEQTVKRFSVTKQPVTIGKAVRRHSLGSLLCPSRGLGHSDDQDATGRLSKDDKALDAFTASRRDNEDGKTLPKQSEGVKRREDLPFLHKRSKGRDPTSRGLTSRGLTFKRVGVDLDP